MLYSILFSLLVISGISAIRAPADVYSAIIANEQEAPVDCTIIWSHPEGKLLENSRLTVEKKNPGLVNERVIPMGTWQARAIVKEIRCGENLSLQAPFDGVTSPSTHWRFRVEKNRIVSVGPSA